jgi:type II secretory pathway pseudopilin PulG
MSLIESCAAVAIISTVAAVAAPSLIRAREIYELDATARQVASRMQSARIKAISRNVDCRIRVTSEVTYAVECEDPAWRIEESPVLPRGFRITANAAPQFHERGNVSPAGTITVWDKRLRSKRIIVNITGRVRVE